MDTFLGDDIDLCKGTVCTISCTVCIYQDGFSFYSLNSNSSKLAKPLVNCNVASPIVDLGMILVNLLCPYKHEQRPREGEFQILPLSISSS